MGRGDERVKGGGGVEGEEVKGLGGEMVKRVRG